MMRKRQFKSEDFWESENARKWRAMIVAEESWKNKTRDQVLHAIDICLMKSFLAKSPWAHKYWHGVAEQLGEKYVD